MQLVSREVLEDLLKSGGEVSEAEGMSSNGTFSYTEFLKEHRRLLAEFGMTDTGIGEAWKQINDSLLKNCCPPIKYVYVDE